MFKEAHANSIFCMWASDVFCAYRTPVPMTPATPCRRHCHSNRVHERPLGVHDQLRRIVGVAERRVRAEEIPQRANARLIWN